MYIFSSLYGKYILETHMYTFDRNIAALLKHVLLKTHLSSQSLFWQRLGSWTQFVNLIH